ncbi:pentatricopeptide repeat-containing protein At1g71490-like [Zingiber officinale]|uniref:Pentatricopeptide repeat-containing protein n=1 Tax=Zingiber officinale TaxID=94328 RepID=A0A8J5GCW5_ZINOF|nr:pentatricopeptide repeat-containing protein At1g71490-like [Zingiber officinale]KAG6503371.1 hypothetical protein ZIOFF_035683 [Zingiber officinale]
MRSPPPLPRISPDALLRPHLRIRGPWSAARPSPLLPPAQPAESLPPPPHSDRLPDLVDSIRFASSIGHLSDAFSAFSLLRRLYPTSCLVLLPCPLSFLLSCSAARSALSQGQQLHALALALGFQDHFFILPKLITFYAACGFLSEARNVADSSKNQFRAWNFLVSVHAGCCAWEGAIFTYKQMIDRGIFVGKYAFSTVFRACGEVGNLGLAMVVHARMAASEVELDLCTWNSLVAMYARCGAVKEARKVFDAMPMRDIISWNTMISGYVSAGMLEEAIELLPSMQEGPGFNTVTCNAIVSGTLRLQHNYEALRLISRMKISGPAMDHVTLVNGLKACSRLNSMKIGKEIHGVALRTHCYGVENIINTLITMYSRCKNMSYAYSIFRTSGIRSLITWNAMITGNLHAEKTEEAYLLFHDMIGSGMQPNDVTIIVMLSLCTRVMNLNHGKELHCYMVKEGFPDHLVLSNCLIGLYSKSRRMALAQRLFDVMKVHDVITYTILIAGYGMLGEGITSLKLFNEMIRSGVQPDHVTMVAILSACSHSGLVNEGLSLFDYMNTGYGIAPRVEHWSCMVDLYCRAGLLKRAEELIIHMPVEPTGAMLATLVGACRVHRNKEVGEWAVMRLYKMSNRSLSHHIQYQRISQS